MLFNSFSFAIFFPLVTALFFALPQRIRWAWLLVASCGFYMFFVPKYLLILIFTIGVGYFAAMLIERAEGKMRRLWLGASIVANVGVLAFFKYFDFFNDNFALLARAIGWNYPISALQIVLPIGLSFHTFQAMSYTIEVYRGAQKAERHFGIFALYVMFYPQLVAGPIERPQNLLPQLHDEHHFDPDRVLTGLRLMAWGLCKKIVVADNLARVVNLVYRAPARHTGPAVVFATILFGFQIYADFSGYSDMARGAARTMGFELMANFDRPYAARSIAEFWRRWHISLTTWFRDYLFIPLGGSRGTHLQTYRNLMIVFLVSGLWHGANWIFVLWGLLHGTFLIAGIATRDWRERLAVTTGLTRLPRIRAGLQIATTFAFVTSAWLLFRSARVTKAVALLKQLPFGWTSVPYLSYELGRTPINLLVCVAIIVAMQVLETRFARVGDAGRWFEQLPGWIRWVADYALLIVLVFGYAPDGDRFIYVQF